MSDKSTKSTFLRDALIATAVLALATWYVNSLIRQTKEAAEGRKFWLYPILLAQWLVVAPVLLAVVLLLLLFAGYGLDYGLFCGIDACAAGHVWAGLGWIVAWIVVILITTGWLYEEVRRETPTLRWKVRLWIVIGLEILTTICGSIPYINGAVQNGFPVYR
jgi:hypothetical protein